MKSSAKQPASPQNPALSPSHLDFPVVGIGASAGGLEAICTLFRQMPGDCGMAFVVVLHLSPDHQSVADRIIQETTQMPVRQVTEPVPIERNHIYVISPANRLSTNDGYLRVTPANRRRGDHVAIDLFFRDLADVHKDHAFCVVLSGTGADGAVGLSRIKEQGGVTLAQTPDDAQYDSMPRAAIETGMVDLVLPAAEMPQKLLELWRNARQVRLPEIEDDTLPPALGTRAGDPQACEPMLEEILLQLRSNTGHDFQHYKRATVLRRIERRLHVTGQADLAAYLHYLEQHPAESRALLADMLIGVTNFFRDREAFEALERHVLPQLACERDPADGADEIRVWSAGCSTGEEAYSLAMLVCEQLALEQRTSKVQVFATDLDERAIAIARSGSYSEAIVTDVPPSRLRQFFLKEDQHYRVRKEVREKVLFARHNLLSDPPFSQIDLIVCRNLLIYLDREVQRDILQMFHFALRPGGYLFLGSSESADMANELFTPVDKRNRIFRALDASNTGRSSGHKPGRQLPGTSAVNMPQETLATAKAKPGRKPSFADLHHRALARRMPPSLIVDIDGNILHMSEGVGRFLQLAGGEPSRNLLNLVLPPLRLALRSTLFQARQGTEAVTSRPVDLAESMGKLQVEITVQPYKDDLSASDCMLVVFEERAPDPSLPLPGVIRQTDSMVLHNLERELLRTRLLLQETIEQSEVSSEELTASNEEMQAINEELRSASEELETSKEELQSINEELLTVNYELKNKVEETDKINDYLSNLIACTEIATVFVDRNLHIRWFTPRATDLFNMLPVDTGRSLLDITHRLDYPALADDARAVAQGEAIIEREIGSQGDHWYLARLLPYRSSEQKIDGTVLTFIDISSSHAAEERVRLGEERLSKQLAETQNTSHMKDEFFAVMSHELKHPLNLIQLNAEILRRLPSLRNISAASKAVGTICDAVTSQARIIDDLLDVARIRTGKLKLKTEPVDLLAVLQGIHGVVVSEQHPCPVRLELPADNLPVMIEGDVTRLEQIIWNLLNNALKFSPAGNEIRLVLSHDEDHARLQVIDHGVGLSHDSLEHIFDLFSQAAPQQASHSREGLGIGLSLVRQLAEAHGGSVRATSPGLGLGCTFTVTLPLCEVQHPQRAQGSEPLSEGRLNGIRVLLVDDSVEVLAVMQELLEMESATVHAFSKPREALDAAAGEEYDIILSDIGMPVMDGHALIKALRGYVHLRHTPAIALTGYGASADQHKSRQSGFDRHLNKPVGYDELVEAIEALSGSVPY
ncbi:Signal transduction histidine kinase with CheB and CheR activity [Pseudomonas sp. JV551A1]|uniref:Signal transduction histidine kinase with CheB and CheR activity n=1 Tax=Pseudomonas inefficax TaxID=2078786 RepID=A0AAQ1P8H6_9PSED|nr:MULTISPECIES: CheR family methyltransferase [Pseudomonas]SPO55631.1 Signal transduction histidine kinase with CheB and CheR activity [Pseudomonas sp. JV551A1]SPO61264.1 Signal transduction histidine kinase with CheB and CheR activity [Pseudomonas inefficax]